MNLLNEVFAEIAKAPPQVIETTLAAGKKIELVLGALTSHPSWKHLRGVRPRGWSEGKTWDDVPGGGGPSTIIAVDKLFQGHGSKNIILHEHAHTYERALEKLDGMLLRRDDTVFLDIWRRTSWLSNYQQQYPEEAFAESFANYFDSIESRRKLASDYPEVAHWFSNRFPGL